MELTWKDGVTTLLAGAAGVLTYANIRGWQGWLSSIRLGVLALGVVGIGMCAFGAVNIDRGGGWITLLSFLGGTALALIVLGLITGSKLAMYVLGADILVLWVLSTLRHAFWM